MPRPGRELLHLTAPVAVATTGKQNKKAVVKGFASIENSESDRSGDVVPPDEFDIQRFMLSPTLLVNHKFWVDKNGNGVAAGRPTEMNAVRVGEIEDETQWGVFDITTGDQVNTFPKEKVPRLQEGDRGLFVVAEVTIDEVSKMVDSGELATFSWRGLVNVDYRTNGLGTTERVLTDIDLYEVSLTHIPDQTSAQAVIVKSADGIGHKVPLTLYCVRMEKSKYESEELATAYLKTHHLQWNTVNDENGSFYGFQRSQSDFDTDSLMTIKMAEGVHIIAGPLKPTVEDSPFVWAKQSLDSEQVEKLAELDSKESEMPHTDEKYESPEACVADHIARGLSKEEAEAACSKLDAKQSPEDATEAPAGGPEASKEEVANGTPYEKSAAELQKFGNDLAQKTAEGVTLALSPLFTTMTETLKSVGSGLETLVESKAAFGDDADEKSKKKKKKKEDEDEDEDEKNTKNENVDAKDKTKAEVGKSADKLDQVFEVLNGLAKNLKQTQDHVVEVAKTADALSKVTPSDTLREERVRVEKSAEQSDPNSVFDSTFPFIGGYDV